ncbi:proline iminopeptidase-family hydrolase [Sphingomonas jatrophae]|uniref:Proline iminopeptidase/L-proline amide hydrolase n=1 Tax=Sphingomonas jatrophae TaxID=1166337 RepID=A0A1I6K0Y2_9SPHN|nr:proline iminopeptidase-family hydrolase [Sphingomonas jatrophae]SFR84876.1 proline iminopeptidase/L-proline amide hydrolase [Sphingomonas jatrophae]
MATPLARRDLLALLGAGGMSTAALAAAPAFAPGRELMVPVSGGRLYVRIDGDLASSRPPLLLIHGGPGGSHYAFTQALALAGTRALILYDQLDCGRSEGRMDPADWTVPRFLSEIEAIRAALGIERWHVLGHSWGGTLALEYGARAPAALAGLILSSPLISTASWIEDAQALVGALPPAARAAIAACDADPANAAACEAGNAAFEAAYYMRHPRDPAVAAYRDAMPRSFTPPLYHAMWGRTEFRCTGTLKDYDGTPLLSRLARERTLFMTGEHDEARPQTIRAFAEAAGARFAVLPGAGHSTLSDARPAWLHTVAGFLAEQDA